MNSIIPKLFVSVMLALSLASIASAQFRGGDISLGLHSGLIGTGDALDFGFDGEIGTGRLGPGSVGLGGLVDFYSWRNAGSYGHYEYIDWIATCMYHLTLSYGRLDPFLGLFIGYEEATFKIDPGYQYLTDGKSVSNDQSSPTLGLGGGIRYFFTRSWAVQARVAGGYGYYLFAVGLNYELRSK